MSGERSDRTRLLEALTAGVMTVAVIGAVVTAIPLASPRRAGVSDTSRGSKLVAGPGWDEIVGGESKAVWAVVTGIGGGGAPAAAAAAVEATLTMAAVLAFGTCKSKITIRGVAI